MNSDECQNNRDQDALLFISPSLIETQIFPFVSKVGTWFKKELIFNRISFFCEILLIFLIKK